MKVTYIKHSGFCIEWETGIWMFDYWQGEIPSLPEDKQMTIFVSHKHGDHFNPEIFHMFSQYASVQYILSDDLRHTVKKQNLPEHVLSAITFMKPYTVYENDGMTVRTLRSTDSGVAFLVEYGGKVVYHAGDLNWWVWHEESKQEYCDMTARFQREIAKLKEWASHIDVAFVPLDPRQEDWYRLGMDYFVQQIDVDTIFPMHFWESYEWIEKYKATLDDDLKKKIVSIEREGVQYEEV